jgi:hypothetical protein
MLSTYEPGGPQVDLGGLGRFATASINIPEETPCRAKLRWTRYCAEKAREIPGLVAIAAIERRSIKALANATCARMAAMSTDSAQVAP